MRVIIAWLLFWFLGFFMVLHDALLIASAVETTVFSWLVLASNPGCFIFVLDASVRSIGTASRTWVVPLDVFIWLDCVLKSFPALDRRTLSRTFVLNNKMSVLSHCAIG